MKKPSSGRYLQGSTAGIDIYDDGTFALFGYATLLWGKYTLEKNHISFRPDIPKQAFVILGRNNNTVKKGVKLTFAGSFMRHGPIYIQFDEAGLTPVFGKDFSSGESSYTKQLAYRPKSITLVEKAEQSFYKYNSNSFMLAEGYNDFLLYYAATYAEQEPFEGLLEQAHGGSVLNSRWGKFEKQKEVTDMEWDTYMKQSKKQQGQEDNASFFYFNDQLKAATGRDYLTEDPSTFNISNYILDPVTNKYIRKDVFKKGADYSTARASNYHDERYMLKYERMPLMKQFSTNFASVKQVGKPLFVTKEDMHKKVADQPGLVVPVEPPMKIIPTQVVPPESGKHN